MIKTWLAAFAVMLITSFALTACGSDNDEPDNTETSDYAELIVGKWIFDDESDTGLEFKSNGTAYDIDYDNGNWKTDGTPGKWKLNQKNLTIDWGDEDVLRVIIVNLDKNSMTFQYNDPDKEFFGYQESLTRIK